MELVAASKMRRSVQAVLSSRPYAALAWETVRSVSREVDPSLHPLLRRGGEKTGKILVVLLTSDRGLAGGFNTNVVRKALGEMRRAFPEREIDVVAVGKRGAEAVRRAGKTVIASFTGMTNHPRFEDILPLSRFLAEEFTKGTYGSVLLAYTDFFSALSQKPTVVKLLPVAGSGIGGLGEVGKKEEERPSERRTEYCFEPSPREVLERMLPRLVSLLTYQAVLESAASEHAARMMAMRSASDAAAEMIENLSFAYNQMRQAGITREIAEISGGKAALET